MKKLCILGLLFFLPALGLAQPTAHDIHQSGIISVPQVIEAYNKAIQGNAYSQAETGEALINGSVGVLPNYDRALYWFNKSIKQGEPLAYLNLSMLYRSGNGVRQDTKKAQQYAKLGLKGYAKKVAKKEYDKYQLANVQYRVADLYFWGVPGVVKQNLSKAFKIYYKSANAGFVHSIKRIILMYSYGIGVKKNTATAYEWTLLLATAGDLQAQYVVGFNNLEGIGVKKNVTNGIKWIRKAATSHYTPAVTALYMLSRKGVVKLTPEEEKSFNRIVTVTGDNVLEILKRVPHARF